MAPDFRRRADGGQNMKDTFKAQNLKRVVMEIHCEIWNNDILRPELPLSLFNNDLCRVYNNTGAQNGTGCTFKTSQNLYKEVFHKKRDAWEKLRYERGVEILPCLSRSVRPLVREIFGQYIFPLQCQQNKAVVTIRVPRGCAGEFHRSFDSKSRRSEKKPFGFFEIQRGVFCSKTFKCGWKCPGVCFLPARCHEEHSCVDIWWNLCLNTCTGVVKYAFSVQCVRVDGAKTLVWTGMVVVSKLKLSVLMLPCSRWGFYSAHRSLATHWNM